MENGKDEFVQIFSKQLRYFISTREATQEQVADAVGVSPATVSYWCKGERVPRMDKVDALCRFFRCTRDDLLTDRPSPVSMDLSTDERILLEWYRTAPEHDRDFIRRMMAYSNKVKRDINDEAI